MTLKNDGQPRKVSKFVDSNELKYCNDDSKSRLNDGSRKRNLKHLNISSSLLVLVCLTFFCLCKPAYASRSESKQENTNNGFLSRKVLSVDDSVVSEWDKLSRRKKIRILDSNVEFQGKIIKFNSFNNLYPQLFKSLTLDQLNSVLNRVHVGNKVDFNVDFYVERRFKHEDAKLIRFEFQFGHDFVLTYDDPSEHESRRTANKTFKEFHAEFLKQDLEERTEILRKVRDNKFFQSVFYSLNENVFHFLNISSKELIEQAEKDKVLVLSSETGLGKTTTLKHIALEIKNKFPTKWVSYIDLKNCTNLIEAETNAENIEELLIEILGLDSGFEIKVFLESFKSGNVVLFWDDFGEICSDYVSNLLKFILENTSNIQFLSTDTSSLNQLSELFNVRALLLIPFDYSERNEFLGKIFKSKNSLNIDEKIKDLEKIYKIFETDEPSPDFYNPTVLKLMVQNHDASFPLKSDHVYKIYENMVDKKIEYWINQNQDLLKGKPKLFVRDLVKRILQKYAILNIHNAFSPPALFTKILKLQIMQIEIPEDFPLKEISQMKLFNDKNKFHYRSFAQFLLAQFFIENIFYDDSTVDSNEAELRLELFHQLVHVHVYQNKAINDLMSSFLLTRNKNNDRMFNFVILTLLRTKFSKFFIRILDTNNPKKFEFLFEFFKKDHNLLVDLLHVNDDETFYTAIFNPSHFALFINPEEIKSLVKNCLTDQEFDKFVTGKNQKGIILSGMHFYNLLNVTKLDDAHIAEFQVLNSGNLSYWEFLKKLKESLTLVEQRQLFKALLSPKIYMYYDKLFNISDFSEYENLWSTVENLSTKRQISDILGDAFINYIEVGPTRITDHQNYFSLLLKKSEQFLSSFEIYEMFLNKNILHEAVWSKFEDLWNFLKNHTNENERKTTLLINDLDDKIFYFYGAYLEDRQNVSSYSYSYYPYDFTPYNIFHRSLVRPSGVTYEITEQIYKNHFNKTEMQEMILSSNYFIVVLITMSDTEPCEKFVKYLEELFNGNKQLLKEYFDQKIHPTNFSLLEYVEKIASFGDYEDQTRNLKAFNDFYKKL